MKRRFNEAAQRYAERRQREDEAARLHDEVPRLESLKLEISEHRAGSRVAEPSHTRRIVVPRAPALFVIPCGDSACTDGGHDITYPVMRALRAGETRFEGEDACRGQIRSSDCDRVLRFVATATYSE